MIGRTIGRIHIDGALGAGGMGEVYSGFDETLGRRVAVKAIRSKRRGDERHRNRLLREARALSQLDHPNICRLWDYVEGDDVDLLVLEYIDGRTLNAKVGSGLSFPEKLRIARAIADVLVVAHRHGIVHRDLKPDNVMITEEGQVKVLDFGLARFIRDDRTSVSGPAVRVAHRVQPQNPGDVSEHDATATMTVDPALDARPSNPSPSDPAYDTMQGVAVGTPRFMSPEQARGEEISTASDMYSFGMLLAYLFSGRVPNAAISDSATLLAFAAVGKVNPVTGLDGELTSLIDALRQPARSDRPTASEALRRLERIADRPARRVRFALTFALLLVAVAAVAKYTMDLKRERAVAENARAEAQARREDADELIAFMLGDLRRKLEPLGKLDVLDAASAKSLEYFDSLSPDTLSPIELSRNAKALYQLGEVRRAQGSLAEATAAFDRSLALSRKAVKLEPGNTDLRMELGASEFYVGNAYRLSGDLDSTRTHFENYLGIATELVALDPASAAFQSELGYAHSNLGFVDEAQGRLIDALDHYRVLLGIAERQLDSSPDDQALRYELPKVHNKIGLVQFKRGLVAEAREQFRREMELRDALLAEKPDDMKQRERLAHSYWFRSSVEAVAGNYEQASDLLEHEVTILEELTARDPENKEWQRHLGSAYQSLAEMRHALGRGRERDEALKTAHTLLEGAIARDPSRAGWHRDLAKIETVESIAALDRNRADVALRSADAALERLARNPTGELSDVVAVGEASLTKAEALAMLGRHREAAAEWQRVVELLDTPPEHAEARLVDVVTRAALKLGMTERGTMLYNQLQRTGYASPSLRALCAKIPCA